MKWDKYFYNICNSVATKSPCLSRRIGAIIVRDKSIVSTGYNGPPRGIPHCGAERLVNDKDLRKSLLESEYCNENFSPKDLNSTCPRKLLGYPSGTHMDICPAQHAEENAVSNAARLGVCAEGTTLYLNSIVPCKNCLGVIINAGIKEIVVTILDFYDELSEYIFNNSSIIIREFEL